MKAQSELPLHAAEWVLATRNPGKLREFEQVIGPLGPRLRSVSEFPNAEEPEETGSTFSENAILKAQAAAIATGRWALADDSGLCVDALNGAPGVHSARYAEGDDSARRKALLRNMAEVEDGERGARFECVLALVSPDGSQVYTSEGQTWGTISHQERGSGGFGYDPIFLVKDDPQRRTMAQLSPEEKNAISHRGRALARLVVLLKDLEE